MGNSRMECTGLREKSSPPNCAGGRRSAPQAGRNSFALLTVVASTVVLLLLTTLTGCSFHGEGAPTARAGGPYTAYTNASITLSAANSTDPQNETLTYTWSFGDGGTGSGASPTHTYTTAGTYTATVSVTNQHQLSSSASATVTVLAAKPPVASAGGPYTGVPGTAIAFSAAGSSDPQGQTLTYSWSFGDGSTGTGISPAHTYTLPGTYAVTLTATNQSSLAMTASTTATVAAPAQPPVANAGGPYTGATGVPVTLSGAASSDPKGEQLTYAWNFGDNTTGTGISPAHTYATAGRYTVTLTVTNTDGLTATANATVTISAPSQPPTANAGGPYTGTTGIAVTFNGSGSTDPKGETLTYAWNFGDNATGTGVSPGHTYSTAGKYTVTLTVTNTDGLTATASATATISNPAQPPLANAGGPYAGTTGVAVSFNGSGSSDPKGETLTFSWNFGDSSSGAGVSPTHVYAVAGKYTVTLTVTNTDGASATATATATIVAPQPPVANAGGPYTGTTGTAVTFTAAGSTDPRGETLTYSWNFGDNTNGTGVSPAHTYTAAGTYNVTLTATNTDGLTGAASTTATISNPPQAPTANAGGPYAGVAGTSISFSGAASSDPKGESLSYSWNFGDGGAGTGPNPAHTYTGAGVFAVTLTVTNTDKLTATATSQATITAAAQAPTANAGGPYTGTAGTAVSFNGAASTDPKNEVLTYTWSFGDSSSGTGVAPTHIYATAGTYTVSLAVTNTDGLSSPAVTTTATIAAAPQPPIANAGGPYTGVAGTAVSFSGAASSDPRNETLTYAWDFGDSSTGAGVSPTHSYAAAGTYTVTLTVTNTENLSSHATATATIAPAIQPPVAKAGGPYTGTAGSAISFSGAASTDPQGQALTYSWSFGDGGNGTGVAPTHVYTNAGTYTATLTVTNTSGLTNSANASVTVSQPAPSSPAAVINGPYTGTAGTAVSFTAKGSSDPANETLTYLWSFGDGATSTTFAPTHTYATAGTYSVSLTVTNTDGKTGSASTQANINAVNAQRPTVTANGPYTGTTGTPVVFTALGSSDPANPNAGAYNLTLAWSFGDGGTGAGPTPVHTYTAAGTYTATVTATTGAGQSSSASSVVTISAGPAQTGVPTANPNGPYKATANTAVQFSTAGSSDPNGLTLTYMWDFGDGSTSSAANPTHTYTSAGNYSVLLTVSNGASSAQASTVASITAAPAAAMTATAGGPYTVAQGQLLSFAGTATNPNNRQLMYTWDFGDGVPGSGASPTHIYTAQGTYTASLNVTDGAGATANATAHVTVTAPPAEAITATAGGPYADVTGHAIVFDASGSQDNLGKALTYSWNFGDGATGAGATASHTYTTPGAYTATVTATSGSVQNTATATVTISAALGVTITSPAPNALFSTTTVNVTGTLPTAGLSVAVNGIAATVSGTSFTASGVSLREGVNLITATASDGKGGIGTGAVSVILDVTAPGISITSPANNATVTTPNISIAGLVNDVVTGTVGSNDVSVSVNGQAAQVSNRSYLLSGITLVPGANTITAVATDKVGNTGKASITVNYAPPSNQLSLAVYSGNNQTAQAATVLAQPLVVQLLSANGAPVAGRPVTFTVTRSDGKVEVLPTITQSLYVSTDATGKASVLFQLGSRAGLGINQVTATTPGAGGAALFFETSTAAPPTQIHIVRGENQRGLLGQQLAEGLQTIVQDAYGNAIPGVTVNYALGGGDGTIDNTAPVTDSNGKALANLTLGQQEGVSNYAVTATFNGNTGNPVTFLASGYAAGAVSNTKVSGQVLDNSNMPVVNATVRLLNTQLSAVTDTQGHFSISGAPVGTVTISVDGSTSTSTQTFPFLSFVLESLPGVDNTLGKPVFLPSIDADRAQTVGGDDPVTITMANVPGVSFTVAPHSVTFPDGSTVGKLSVSQVKSDMVPMEPVNGSSPNLIWTLQPAGTRFSTPVQVTFPNTQALAPGTVTEFYQYDHDLEQFVSAGTAHVSADGSTIISDPGFGITKAGWGHILTQTDPTTCVQSCVSNNPCIKAQLFANCICATFTNPDAKCGKDDFLNIVVGENPDGSDRVMQIQRSCQLQGKCDINGNCTGTKSPAGTDCTPQNYCDIGGKCNGRGDCIASGTVQPQKQIDSNGSGFAATAQLNLTQEINLLKSVFLLINDEKEPLITFQASVVAGSTKTLECCEVKKQMNVEVDDDTVTPTFTLQSGLLPIYIAGAPLSYYVPGFGRVGLFWRVGGTLAGTLKVNVDNCLDKKCFAFGINPSVNVSLVLQLGTNPYITSNLTGTLGVTLGASGGCGTLSLSGGLTPIQVTGSITLLNYVQVNGGFTYTIPYSSITGTLDTTSGDLTFTTPH